MDANQRPVPAVNVTRSPEECVNVMAPRDGTPHDSLWSPPESRQIILPPIGDLPGSMQRKTVLVRFFLNQFGSPTRVDFAGINDSGYSKTLRAIMMGYRYRPAVFRGCVVASTTELSITFIGHNVHVTQPWPAMPIGRTWPSMMQPAWTIGTAGMLPPSFTPPDNCEPKRPSFSYGEWPDATGPGGDGRVELRFVIDSSGTPIDSTVRVLESTAPKYLDAVKKLFPTLHFTPAWCDGGPVAMDVQQLFTFYKN